MCMQKRYPLWICIDSFKMYFFLEFHCLLREFRVTLQGVQQPQEQRYPFLPVCAVFSRVHTMVWVSVSGIFDVHTDVDACDCTRGLYGHRTKVCTKVDSGRNISSTGDSNPRQYCTLLFRRTFCPAELFPFPPRSVYIKKYFRKLPVNDLQKSGGCSS